MRTDSLVFQNRFCASAQTVTCNCKMKLYYLILISILAISCKTEIVKEKFVLPDQSEIVNIIETIISEKKIPVKRDSLEYFHMPLASDLEKLHVYLPDTAKEKEMAPPTINGMTMTKLLRLKVNGKQFFNQKDSTFFLYQNDTLKNIDLHKELESHYYLTTSKEQDNIKKEGGESYWTMSVPIFSKDLKKVYIVVNNYCYGLCGSGGYFLLEKTNNKWTIVDYQMLWIS